MNLLKKSTKKTLPNPPNPLKTSSRMKVLKLYFLIIQITTAGRRKNVEPFMGWKHSIFGAPHAGNYNTTSSIPLGILRGSLLYSSVNSARPGVLNQTERHTEC